MKKYAVPLGFVLCAIPMLASASAESNREKIEMRYAMADQDSEHRMAGFLEEEGAASDITLPKGARIMRDIAYGSDDKQKLDVYLPEHATGAPVIFMVHGGAWMIGDKAAKAVVANKVARWLPKGFILVSVNYRLLPAADPLEQADDVAKALSFAQSKAASWGGDPARFVLMGHSAGAHLVSLLAADPGIATKQGAKPWLGTISLDSASLDVVQTMEANHFRFYDRVFKQDPNYWRSASPIHRLTGTPWPMLMVCSSNRADSCPQARNFAARVTSLGGRITVLPIALTHGEINKNLGLDGKYTDGVESFINTLGLP